MNECFKVEYVKFDSQEEADFMEWLTVALACDYIKSIDYHPEPYDLILRASKQAIKRMKTKDKVVDKFLCHGHSYTLDFLFVATDRFQQLDHGLISLDNKTYYVDVKGGFSIYNNHREFSINRKLMLERHGVYVNDVVPKKLFARTFCPAKCRMTAKTGQPRKHYYNMPQIKDVLASKTIKTPITEWVEKQR